MIAKLKPYPRMKESSIPWIAQLPSHWTESRGKALFMASRLPVCANNEVVTCFRDGQVTLRRNRRATGFMIALKEAGYQGVRRGQLVIHAMDAFAGAVGVSDSDGKCTPEYIVCNPRESGTSPDYFARALGIAAESSFIEVACQAVRERAPRLRYPNFGAMILPRPPTDEQAAIVRYLDHVDLRVRRLVRAKRKSIGLLTEQRRKATREAIESPCTRSYRLEIVADLVERPVERLSEKTYIPIGLHNRGRGIFLKVPRKGDDLGDSNFFWIEEDDLVISGQFAWEGAIAVAGEAEAGCVASHRYPIVRGKQGILDSGFLLSFLQTDWGQLLLDHHSRGAAGRNRPLNARSLLKEKISVPLLQEQQRIAEILRRESLVRQGVEQWIQLLSEYRTRLIADVVTGKLDVREAAASLPDESDNSEPETDLEDLIEAETDHGDDEEHHDQEPDDE